MKIVEVGDYVCKVGESSRENWELLDQAKKGHWFFHLTDFPSPYVVLECGKREPSAETKEQCAQLCVNFSKQKSNKDIKVDVTLCSNVRVDRKDDVGECDYRDEGKVEIIVVNPKGVLSAVPASTAEKGAEGVKRRGKHGDTEAGVVPASSKPSDKFAVAEGKLVSIKKSIVGGWAVVTFQSVAVSEALLRERQEILVKGGCQVKLKKQVDPLTEAPVPGGVFATWGRAADEKLPISEKELLRCFEALARQLEEQLQRNAPTFAAGEHVRIRKAAAGGCAVVTVDSTSARNAILALGDEVVADLGIVVKLRPQVDPKSKDDIPDAIFAAWGRKVEETTPLADESLLRCFEGLYARAVIPDVAAPTIELPAAT